MLLLAVLTRLLAVLTRLLAVLLLLLPILAGLLAVLALLGLPVLARLLAVRAGRARSARPVDVSVLHLLPVEGRGTRGNGESRRTRRTWWKRWTGGHVVREAV